MRLTIVNSLLALSIVNPAFGDDDLRDHISTVVMGPCADAIEDKFIAAWREDPESRLSEDAMREIARTVSRDQAEAMLDSLETFYTDNSDRDLDDLDTLSLALCRAMASIAFTD